MEPNRLFMRCFRDCWGVSRMKAAEMKAAIGKHCDRTPRIGGGRLSSWTAAPTIAVFVAAAVICGLFVADLGEAAAQDSSANGVAREDVQIRDNLIADQESLLNAYRCLFNVDTQVVPGGCIEGRPSRGRANPGSFSGTPNQQGIAIRDLLVDTQESLLNAYRCMFDIDTQVVPGGCHSGMPAQSEPEPETDTTTGTAAPQDDPTTPPVEVSFSSAAYTVAEGATAWVGVELDRAPNRTVVIPLTTTFHGGATPADFDTLPGFVTFAADETIQAVSFTVTDDQQSDPGESIKLAIGQTLPDKVTTDAPGQTIINIADTGVPTPARSVIDVSVFYCASESRGYNQADLIYETDLMNEIVGGFYARESSGLSTLRFLPSGIVTPDLDWNNSTIAGEMGERLWDPNHTGIRECFYDAQLPGDYQQFLFLVDMIPGKQGAFGSPYFYVPNLRESVGMAVVSTVESQYESSYFCSNDGDIPHRIREQPGNILPNLQSSYGYIASNISCRYIIYWNYLFVIGHELGHSVYDLRHPPGCSIMGRGYTRNDKCPTIRLNGAMQFSSILDGLYVDCVDRESLGWPVVRDECSSPPPPVNISFELSTYAVEEGTSAQVTVELDTVPFRTLTIPLTYTFQGGATASDVGTLPASVTFGPNETTKTIAIPVNDDSDDEFGEGVEVSFGAPLPADVSLEWSGAPVQTTVSFSDAAPPTVQVSFASAT